ncbi:SDR family oxidoreductase [Immundisolibacter sp.]|uniref:SDR family oxidoreductase n=1 Tax=Immundisolibacter sp. TaxID=1934948 RepID=UPI002B15D327|nr:SDR family oxidoreductase [Immundisolibacter sp.]MEA3219042.1 3-oxoacyl-[acyl-carrier-protein] reductase FabG [Immundisolibacter sp.]
MTAAPTADLSGRVALVTGAARRTGRGLALALARAGADVVVHYGRSRQDAESAVAEIAALGRRGFAISADLAVPGQAEALIEAALTQAGRLDVLVNNVGNYPLGDPLGLAPEQFRATLETNLIAPYALIRAALPALVASGAGQVINLGYAGVEHMIANTRAMAYQISKAGLLVLTRSLAQALGPQGVRVNMVSPGHIDNSVDLPADIEKHVPLGRPAQVDDIAGAVLFLLSPAGGYITGANIEVAGGYRLSLADTLD